jgi:hypothetical protein
VVPDRTFFAVQRRFAERWASVASIAVEEAYLECTTWYHQAADLGRDFDPSNADWRRLLEEMASSPDPDAVVHAWARANEKPITIGPVLDSSWAPEDREVRLLFHPERSRGGNPLGDDELAERRAELRDVVRRAATEHPDAVWLRGKSWLYGLASYRRIFPAVFLDGLVVEPPEMQFLATWGQLLDRRWRARPDVAADLLARADAAGTTADLEAAFPIPMRLTRAPLEDVAAAL